MNSRDTQLCSLIKERPLQCSYTVRSLAIALLSTMYHTMMKIEVREAAITRAIIAASHRPLLGPIASVYKKKEFNPDPNPD